MKEEFLQFIWEHGLFNRNDLKTVDDKPVEIITTGQPNLDSGPDFFNARIQIGETTWAGNIEIHQKSSHWYRHRHNADAAYNNVILHVVEQFDSPVLIKSQPLPTLVISYPAAILENYEQLLKSERWIACEERISEVDPFILRFWFSSLMIERLQTKTADILAILEHNKNNWNETFYPVSYTHLTLPTILRV